MTSQIRVSNITNKDGTSGTTISGVTTSVGTGYAKIPSGDNTQRVGIEEGSIRYNETAKLLEFYDGTQWNFIIPAEESANALGVFGGGYTANSVDFYINTIDYITISTTGDAKEFGILSIKKGYMSGGGCSSSTRGVCGGGYATPVQVNSIDYITISSKGNSQYFGNLTDNRGSTGSCSSSTRGVFGGGTNVIDYITIATTGNATDFGDLTQTRYHVGSCASSTRGVFFGGRPSPGNTSNTIDYITIATTGNATDFGDLRSSNCCRPACSSSTRGVYGGGGAALEYVTIASTGNSQIFGYGILDKSKGGLAHHNGACSSSIRGVWAGGSTYDPYASINSMEYITIATLGDAFYFGDLTVKKSDGGAVSNNHGGLL